MENQTSSRTATDDHQRHYFSAAVFLPASYPKPYDSYFYHDLFSRLYVSYLDFRNTGVIQAACCLCEWHFIRINLDFL